jgi:hypothetical protein
MDETFWLDIKTEVTILLKCKHWTKSEHETVDSLLIVSYFLIEYSSTCIVRERSEKESEHEAVGFLVV